jgi:hypothetical protein
MTMMMMMMMEEATMVRAVSCRSRTAEDRVRYRTSPCGICGKQSDTATGFAPSTSVSPPVSSIRPVLHTHSSIYHQRYIMLAINSVVIYFIKYAKKHFELGGGVSY